MDAQVLWRSARARGLADREPTEALALAKDAVARAAATGIFPVNHGDALMSLAHVHEAAARLEEARGAIEQAIAVFQAKGATAYVEDAAARRAGLLAKSLSSTSHADVPKPE